MAPERTVAMMSAATEVAVTVAAVAAINAVRLRKSSSILTWRNNGF
jgi:hypothetical protein